MEFARNTVIRWLRQERVRKFCGKFAEISRKFAENFREIRLLRQERVRKFCGKFAEISGKFSAMTPSGPSRTTP